MKTIGLIGGMSWESTLTYYRIINETTSAILGGLHSAKSLMYSVDLQEIKDAMDQDNWSELTETIIDIARKLENAGADFVLICTNTIHKIADEVQNSINIPLLHIADATAESIKEKKLKTIGLLGTQFVMEQDFYKGRLFKGHNIKTVIPEKEERKFIHEVIFSELCVGNITEQSKNRFAEIIENLTENGAEGIILGCTEIPLLIQQKDVEVPIFDTTEIHAKAAVNFAMQ